MAMVTAWQTGAFAGAAYAGKLKQLSEYEGRRDRKATAQQMIDVLEEASARGAPITIRRVKRKEVEDGDTARLAADQPRSR